MTRRTESLTLFNASVMPFKLAVPRLAKLKVGQLWATGSGGWRIIHKIPANGGPWGQCAYFVFEHVKTGCTDSVFAQDDGCISVDDGTKLIEDVP